MEGQGTGSLPIAALSLHAFPSAGVSALRTTRPRKAAAANVATLDRSSIRSHPIAGELLSTPAHAAAEGTRDDGRREQREKPNSLGRFVTALPAALSRLVSAPIQRGPFLEVPSRLSDVRIFPATAPRRAALRGGGDGRRPFGGGGGQVSLVWFRSDLRLHDNPALERACREGSAVLPVYVFDPREYGKADSSSTSSSSCAPRSGPARTRLLLSCLADLRGRLRAAGSELVLRVGHPEQVLERLAREVGAGAVHCMQEVTQGEARLEGRVRGALQRAGCRLEAAWGGSLVHREDLPFRLESLPASYSDFRAALGGLAVRPMVRSEEGIKGLPQGVSIEPGDLPTLEQLGLAPPAPQQQQQAQPAGAATHRCSSRGSGFGTPLLPASPSGYGGMSGAQGGESEALRVLQAFIQDLKSSLSQHTPQERGSPSQQQQQQQQRQQGRQSPKPPSESYASSSPSPSAALSAFSCRISPWLALGCLSPRRLFHELREQLGGPPAITAVAGAGAEGGAAAGAAGAAGAGACIPACTAVGAASATTAATMAALPGTQLQQTLQAAGVSSSSTCGGASSSAAGCSGSSNSSSSRGVAGGSSSSSSNGSPGDWLVFELLWRDFFRFVSLKYTQGSAAAHASAGTDRSAAATKRPTVSVITASPAAYAGSGAAAPALAMA